MTSLAQRLHASFQKHQFKTAISFLRHNQLETRLTFQQLDRESNRLANYFLGRGIGLSDHVIFLLDKSLFSVVAHIALQKIGAVCVPLNPGFKKSELTYLLEDSAPALVLVEERLSGLVHEIDPDLNTLEINSALTLEENCFFVELSDSLVVEAAAETDPGLIIYTSGTTSNPKGAMSSQKNLLHDAGNVINLWDISERDTLCHALPLFHIHGLCFALHTALLSGCHVVLLDQFNAETVVQRLAEKNGDMVCSIFMAVPTMYLSLMKTIGTRSLNFEHLRLLTSGSAPLPATDFAKIHQVFGKEPVEREGMSETGMNFSNPLYGEKKPGSIGLPLAGLQARIVNPDTAEDVKFGQVGEFWLKSDSIISGYWNKSEETSKAFHDGWFRTGDLGKQDNDGYYYLTDRLKNIIITGGENVSPNEIESVINRLDEVVESAVVGIADEKWGEKIVAAVVKKPGTGDISAQITAICKAHLHDWKCPKQIIFLEKLPRNTMGKILKAEIKTFF